MIITTPPFHVIQQMVFGLREGPGAARQQGNALSDREIYSLNISSLNQAAKTLVFYKVV